MSGFGAIGELPIGALEDETAAAAAFSSAAVASQADVVYLIVLQGYKAGEDTSDWIAPFGTQAIGQLPEGQESITSTVTLYYSDRDWATDPSDPDLPNTWFEGRASEPLSIDRWLPLDPTSARRVAVNVGTIELRNEDGALDDLVDQVSFAGRAVTVYFGRRSDPFASFGVVFAGIVAAQPLADGNTVKISVRDKTWGLEATLLDVYAGSGGLEGDAEIMGQVKRRAYGPCTNVTPRWLIKASLVLQLHDGAISSVGAVRDAAVALTLDTAVGTGGDVADLTALLAATIGVGKYITCLALGLVRLRSTPAGAVTVDFHGGKIAGVYVDTVSAIGLGLLRADGGVEDTALDLGAFAILVGLAPGAVSVTFDEQVSVADAVTAVFAKRPMSWWGNKRAGLITCGVLLSPSQQGRGFDTGNIVGPLQLLERPEAIAPTVWRATPAYHPNYTVQAPADLAGAATVANAQLYGQAYVTGTPSADSARLVRDPLAREVLLETGLDDRTTAEAAATEVLDFVAPERKPMGLPLKTEIHLMDLNDPATVTWPRYGLAGGRNAIVYGITEQCSRRAGVLRLWG